jgi:hypothetical protein
MATLFSLIAFLALIFLIIGFFSPKSSLFWDKKSPSKKKSAIIYGAILILSFVVVGVFADPKEMTSKTKAESSVLSSENKTEVDKTDDVVQTKKEDAEPQYNKIGDEIKVGNFSYKVNSVKFVKSVGNEFIKETADGIFVVVNLTLRNDDNEQHTLDNSFFKLTDEQGIEFQSSSEGSTALDMSDQETLFLKECNPKITKSGFLIFEVPEKATYDLHLSGGFWSGRTAKVKLTQ